RNRPAALTGFDCSNNTLTKIIGKRSRHSMLASTPASILNHKTSKNGIPADSTKSGYALALCGS
ncbi:hypothetical protein, partial [Rhizobium laguerreae]|uniref:hypothetical protein n=1 Tax=Rhizobium laguerreae TaxID=1076926 RepID=UPI001C905C5B